MAARGFSRVEEVYNAALERPPRERDRFLDEACAGDPNLLHEVRSLLALVEEAGPFLESPITKAVTLELRDLGGTRLGPYEIADRIGAGGMGAVYRARDTRLGREVAIKVLHETAAGDADQHRRFGREARSAAALNHPNIATIYEIGDHEGTCFIAMEFVEGRTLRDRLEGGALPVTELLELALQIAHGLAKAHAAGIVHRDLKPGNLMVTNEGLVKILDFGLAKRTLPTADVASGITREGSVLGTVQYMSPEQAAARPLDHRSDQFSFGAILYEMATGRRAFERDTAPQTLAAVIQDEPEPLRKLNSQIPVALSAIVDRCLAKDPGRRFLSTADLVRALVLASPAAAAASIRRLPRAAGAIGLGLIAGATALVLSRYPPRPEEPTESPLEVVPLTTYPGYEADPTFSPDGSQVAFTWDGETEDNPDVYVKVIGAERPLRLTTDPARDGSPAWSPDGSRIAFLREKPEGGSEVRLVSPIGGPERGVGDVQCLVHQGLAWSPDGRSLAVVDRSSPGDRLGIVVLDAASGAKERLTALSASGFDILPAFSPDGRTIAFNRVGPFPRVVLASLNGGEPRTLVEAPPIRGRMAWTPHGDEVLFAAQPPVGDGDQGRARSAGETGTLLWRVSVRNGQVHALKGTASAVDVAVSAAAHRLAFSQQTTDWDIWRLDLRRRGSADAPPQPLIASTKVDANPQFSPDGERVAFTSTRSGHGEIWVVDRDGGRPLQVTFIGKDGTVGAPRWSPDGKSIAFDFSPAVDFNPALGPEVDVYVVDASGGSPRRVTTSPGIDATPTWSRDGRRIYFGSNRNAQWQVWSVPSEGEEVGGARQVTHQGGFVAIESTDGTDVYFSKTLSGTRNPQNAIWRVPSGGGNEEVVVESFRSGSGSWDLTARGIYYLDKQPSPQGEPWVVRFLAFGQRRPTEVARLRHPPYLAGPSISVSSDGRWLLSTQGQGGSDLMLVEGFR